MAKDDRQRLYTQTQVDRLVQQAVAPLLEMIAELEAKIARLTRDSCTSSKPPSTDVVKPESKRKRGKRKPGGQQGHPKQERELFAPDQVDEVYEYELTDTTGLRPVASDAGWGVVQQIEWIDKPYRIVEHRVRRYVDVATGRIVTAPLPKEIRRGGLLGPRLTAFVAYLKDGMSNKRRSPSSRVELFSPEDGRWSAVVRKARLGRKALLGDCHENEGYCNRHRLSRQGDFVPLV